MLDVPAGATTLPMPVNFDLKRTMKEHPLIAGFPPLPSQGLILAAAENQSADADEPIYQGRPVAGQPIGVGPVFPGIGLPPGYGGGGRPNNPGNSGDGRPGKGDTQNPPTGETKPPTGDTKPPAVARSLQPVTPNLRRATQSLPQATPSLRVTRRFLRPVTPGFPPATQSRQAPPRRLLVAS